MEKEIYLCQWNPITEEKPTRQNYYICYAYEGAFCAYWDGEKFETELSVTHWMPMPPPPKR